MRKQIFALTLLSLILFSCNTNKETSDKISSNSSDNTSSETTNSSGSTTSNNSSESSNSSEEDQSSEGGSAIDLGEMSIKDAKDYIEEHRDEFDLNESYIGVDYNHTITIKGFALAKTYLKKTTKKYGLNVSYPGKTMMGDDTNYIACASPTNQGSLYYKVGDYAGLDSSRYTVTGYPSIYLGQPELMVTSFTFNEHLDVTKDISTYYSGNKNIDEFYGMFNDLKYNCAGHGYGTMIRMENMTCYYYVSGGSSSCVSYFTDGLKQFKVISRNNPSLNGVYNLVGYMSIENYAPALKVIDMSIDTDGTMSTINEGNCVTMTSADLVNIKYDQDDNNKRFDTFTQSFKGLYKACVYMNLADKSGKGYVCFRDTYYSGYGFTQEVAVNQGMVFIANGNFWNASGSDLSNNPYFAEYIENNPNKDVVIYFSLQQMTYLDNKPLWKVNLIPSLMPTNS